ncbi:amino acid adenylation domain-containing protein [Paraneptunicella aestuarii]|uniref:amino acid adenylation domain-containing protein n=1 Tax=Paraneptunicella aestuarii TaxID=2831148 RepID=UPI001E2F98E5|nr:amino acid adenylation domain-containing protein [Paraneptunicella aestuarii]UAA38140.1 amino acid adenylation domain-containing protein [Paraneptunicella aestuarii]
MTMVEIKAQNQSDAQNDELWQAEIHTSGTLIDMLEQQILSSPERCAVVDGNRELNYLNFYREICRIGNYIAIHNQSESECIGLYCEPSVTMMCGAWGILSSGKAYLPLSPDYPSERIRYMIEDSGITTIYAQSHLKGQINAILPPNVKVFSPEDIPSTEIDDEDNRALSWPVRPSVDGLAYIIYTSGSTGKPKGVMIEHRNIVNQMQYLLRTFEFGENDAVLQKTPMSFDAAQWEILAPVFGCRVVVGPPGCYRDPDALINTIVRHQVTSLQCVPTLLQALVDNPSFVDCTSLNKVFSGGETLTKSLSQEFFYTLRKCELINLYGPSECSINTSIFVLDKDQISHYPYAISIGQAVDNTRYYIVTLTGKLAKEGEIGELCVSGVQVARGYLNRPDLTEEKFQANPFSDEPGYERIYRTGDLAQKDSKGDVHFAGRVDNQIKLRGYRVELDEIRHAIEAHSWIKTAAVLVKNDPRTGYQNLIACVQLNEKEAALMDQGNHDSHHQSKSNKVQVKAQLSNAGCRSENLCKDRLHIPLPNNEATKEQRRYAFGRKTYRFFDGEIVTVDDLKTLLKPKQFKGESRPLTELSFDEFGTLLRYFGQFKSEQRLLPKYAFASPGALYATQIYLEIHQLFDLESGIYYYHPVSHELVLVAKKPQAQAKAPTIHLHFLGKHDGIEPVYKNNILEVLEMETGHMLGVFDEKLPEFGLAIGLSSYDEKLPDWYDGDDYDYYMGQFEIASLEQMQPSPHVDLYVQTHANYVPGMPQGMYRYADGEFELIGSELIARKEVIAINQQVYDRASFGIAMISNGAPEWMHYINLGRKLHSFQSNDLLLGMMSSGYSSKSGNDLPSARKMRAILEAVNDPMDAFYFCIGGHISQAQYVSEGMREDAVHMKGPAEILRDDLGQQLPSFMVPNKVLIMNNLPQTANGKVDYVALSSSKEVEQCSSGSEFVPLETDTEKRLGKIWKDVMKWDSASAADDFFETGGNSLMAVALVNRINSAFQSNFPLQVLFQYPTIAQFAKWIESENTEPVSRLIKMNDVEATPIFCWPGLGGYPMNLRRLAELMEPKRGFYGVQSKGINAGEAPYATIQDMAAEDIVEIKRIQPEGPYTLWGYSFGSRVAFETAHQMEQAGDEIESLYLIAPGSPKIYSELEEQNEGEADFDNPVFVTILFSVFAHNIHSPMLKPCLEQTVDEASFVNFICSRFRHLEPLLVRRIVNIVTQTYDFKYSFEELHERKIKAPIRIFKASGDNYSFIENAASFSVTPPQTIHLQSDHYELLKEKGSKELADAIWDEINAS